MKKIDFAQLHVGDILEVKSRDCGYEVWEAVSKPHEGNTWIDCRPVRRCDGGPRRIYFRDVIQKVGSVR